MRGGGIDANLATSEPQTGLLAVTTGRHYQELRVRRGCSAGRITLNL